MTEKIKTVALLATAIAILSAIAWVAFWTWVDARNLKRKINSYPKAGPVKKKKSTALDYDLTENYYTDN